MRRRGRTDANQAVIVRDLRKMGASVLSISEIGSGAPDLLVGWQGKNFAFEIKDPCQPLSGRRLTEDEKVFHDAWRGQVSIAESIEDVWEVLKRY